MSAILAIEKPPPQPAQACEPIEVKSGASAIEYGPDGRRGLLPMERAPKARSAKVEPLLRFERAQARFESRARFIGEAVPPDHIVF
jgi:hypothetical protein